AVLALGLLAVLVGTLVVAFLASLRATLQSRGGEPTVPARTSTLVAGSALAGLTPVATTGVRMAFERGRGPTTVPVRSAVFGAVFGVLGVVAVLTFASSLAHLVVSSTGYGCTSGFG